MSRTSNFKISQGAKRSIRSVGLALLTVVILAMGVSACSPPGKPLNKSDFAFAPNQTGGTTKDGKANTGAASDRVLEKLKEEIATGSGSTSEPMAATIESVSKVDRDLATRIESARMDVVAGGIRVQVALKDAGIHSFDFTQKEIIANGVKDEATDVRFKATLGKTADGGASGYEISMLCHKQMSEAGKTAPPGCRSATLVMKDLRSQGGKAGIVLRSQETTVLAKSKFPSVKHAALKRLLDNLKNSMPATFTSFEVAFGASRFSLNFGDSEICPGGRLVETNDLDEQLKLNCPGVAEFRDLDGRMIGNTTRGELFLEITAATPGLVWGENVENIFILVQQKRAPKKVAPPGTPTPAPGAPASEDDDDDDADESIFKAEKKAELPAPMLPATAGWFIPVSSNATYAKVYASDRKNPIIANEVEKQLKQPRLKSFALHFIPNRNLVAKNLATYGVPTEFALLMVEESGFFTRDGYPIEAPLGSSAAGMWQMLDRTAQNSGLKIYERGTKSPKTRCLIKATGRW